MDWIAGLTGLLDWTDGLTGLLDWIAGLTGLLDLIHSYHMTFIESNLLNLVTLTALCCYKLHFIFPLHGRECI